MITPEQLAEIEAELDDDNLSCADWCFTSGRELCDTLSAALKCIRLSQKIQHLIPCQGEIPACLVCQLRQALEPFNEGTQTK